jgi:hypothetical protein
MTKNSLFPRGRLAPTVIESPEFRRVRVVSAGPPRSERFPHPLCALHRARPSGCGRLSASILSKAGQPLSVLKLRLVRSLETQCKPGTPIRLKRGGEDHQPASMIEAIAPLLHMAEDCMLGETEWDGWKRCNENMNRMILQRDSQCTTQS